MKIACVYDAVYPYVKGGVERRIWEIGVRLAKRGHEIHLFGVKYWPGPADLQDSGIFLHGIAPKKPFYRDGRRYSGQALEFGTRLIFPLSRERFDLIDCQQFPYFSAFPSMYAAKIKKSALVLTWHEVWARYWYEYLGIAGFAGRVIERIVAELPSFRVAVSEQTKRDLIVLSGGKPVELIPNGIEFSSIQETRPSSVESDVIYAGRLIREKHIDMLIDAIAILAEKDAGIRCRIIGEGPEKESLMKKATGLGLGEHVTFTGFLEYTSMISLLKASKVFVLPSTREGFGMAALEGLACGLPLVTVDFPSNASRHLVREGETGALCRLDPCDIAEKIVFCGEAKNRMTGACTGFAAGFDWDPITTHIERFYTGIAG